MPGVKRPSIAVPPLGRWEPTGQAQGQALAELASAEWFRVVPVGPELGAQAHLARLKRAGPPRPRPIVVDAKLIGPAELMDASYAPRLLCSGRFVEALATAGATGWSVKPARHVTQRAVAGHPVFELSCNVTLGPFVETVFHSYGSTHDDAAPWGRVGAPVSPVTLDASGTKVALVGWTEYVEVESDLPWRGLLVHRRVVEELAARWRAPLELEPVTVRDVRDVPRPPRRSVRPRSRAPVGLASLAPLAKGRSSRVLHLRETASRFEHVVPPSAPRAVIRKALATMGLPVSSPLEPLLRETNGPILFGGSLAFCFVGKRNVPRKTLADALQFDIDDLAREQRRRRFAKGGVDVPDGRFIFARGYGGEVYWTIDASGVVRGYGQSGTGIEYGPEVAFDRWFADQIADLELAWAARGREWAATMLGV